MVAVGKGDGDGTAGATDPRRDKTEARKQRRDLVLVGPAAKGERPRPRSRLLDALFVAHMVATRFQAPQTRAKRRADPADASASYRSTAKGRKPQTGLVVSRKV